MCTLFIFHSAIITKDCRYFRDKPVIKLLFFLLQFILVILHALLLVYYILNACHLFIFRYTKERATLTGAISNSRCLFILTPQDKLDLQASRPQIYLLFNNLRTKRSSSSFLFPFIKVQVLMKNN